MRGRLGRGTGDGHHDHHVAHVAVGDEHLAAVEDVVVTVLHRRRANALQIAERNRWLMDAQSLSNVDCAHTAPPSAAPPRCARDRPAAPPYSTQMALYEIDAARRYTPEKRSSWIVPGHHHVPGQ